MSDFDQFFNDRAGFSSAFNAIQGSRQRLSLLESQEKALAEQLRAAQDAATHADRMEDHAARMEEHATRVEKLEKQRVEIERCRMDIEIQERKAASDKSGELRWMRRLLHEAGRELLSIRQWYPANGEPAERPDSELNARLAVLQATDELISERDPFDELVDMGAQSSFHEDMVQYIEDAADAGVCSKSPLTHVRDAVSFKADVIREMIGFMRACRKPSELLRAKVIYQFTETEIQAIDRDSRQLLGALRPTLTSFVPRLNETESRFDIDLNSDHMKFLNQLTGDLEPFLTLLNGEEMRHIAVLCG